MRCSRLILASTLVFLPACASKVQTVAQPIVTPQMRLASADAHMRAGCLDCLENAYREYVALRSDSMVGEAAKQGALRAAEHAARRRRLHVIVGEEVSSRDGHIIGLFLEHRVKPGMSAAASVHAIHEQGGLAIAAHPFWRTRVPAMPRRRAANSSESGGRSD